MTRTAEYGDLTLDYEIEQTEEGSKATILKVSDEDGTAKNIDYVHPETLEDMQSVCESDFFSVQVKHYKATGETLYK